MNNKVSRAALFSVLSVFLLAACSKSGSSPESSGAPTNLSISVKVVGAKTSAPNGDGSGKVDLSFSATNANAFQIVLPTESNKTYTLSGSSGTVECVFTSAPGTTTEYPIKISAYHNAVKKDTTIYVTVYCDPTGQNIVWSDEFDGTSLNTNIWNYEKGNLGVNNEVEYYTSDAANISVKGGYLQITALNSPNYSNSGYNYTSARINTYGKYSFTYGRVDVRAKIPGDPGTWPALWLLGNSINTGTSWPACGEIDMMEAGTVWGADVVGSSLHWGGDYSKTTKLSGSATDFHIYSMDWRADHISFYYDGTLLYTWTNDSGKPFNAPFFFIFNVAVGGNLGGSTINLGSGSTMYVDYVRVYN